MNESEFAEATIVRGQREVHLRRPRVQVRDDIRRVISEAKRWGIDVEVRAISERLVDKRSAFFAPAPRHSFGIDVAEGVALRVIADEAETSYDAAAGLMHEVAHCIEGGKIDHADEEGAMLAIEHEAARRLRYPWAVWMNTFEASSFGDEPGDLRRQMYSAAEWGVLTPRERSVRLNYSYKMARERGFMTTRNKPTYRRST